MNTKATYKAPTNPEYLRLSAALKVEHEKIWAAYFKNPKGNHNDEFHRLRILRHELHATPTN